MASSFKKDQSKINLSTDIDMLFTVERAIRGGICHAIYQYAKANNKYMKDYDKHKEPSYLKYLVVNNLFEWAMSQKLPLAGFTWVNVKFKHLIIIKVS